MRLLLVMLALGPWSSALQAEAIALASPLTTQVELPGGSPGGEQVVIAEVIVPSDAPSDLGVGAWTSDAQGRWYGRGCRHLAPGISELALPLAEGADPPLSERHDGAWNPAEAAKSVRAGLFFFSAGRSRAVLQLRNWHLQPASSIGSGSPRLLDLQLPASTPEGCLAARTGERWSLSCLPEPFPQNPYDARQFSLALVLTDSQGHEQRYEGFLDQPMRSSDRGDEELVVPAGPARFEVRVRLGKSGRYQARLEASWAGGPVQACRLPPVEVDGQPWDQYVRVDSSDHRFFEVGGRWFFPLGPNLRSVWDLRCHERLGTTLTPDRCLAAYHAYFERLATAHITAVEVWMSAWNLALEWRSTWPGFYGCGRYNEINSWRLDRLLDDAWAHGIRVNLVIDNHGQASDRTDHEWENNPYNRDCGGTLTRPSELFGDARALELQEQLRRYLVARYGDHPGLLAWKLWSEINLTAAARSNELLRDWHEQATARWHALDPYHHPCTTHWAGDYHAAVLALPVASLPGLDFLCVDAYHTSSDARTPGEGCLCDLLLATTGSGERSYGLSRLGKPVLVTEYGGYWNACPPAQLAAEHASSAFAALVCGHAGAPMLWWFEWLDQGDRMQPYAAFQRFIAGEDLRDPVGGSLPLETASDGGALWARAWSHPGRMLGYCLDRAWQADGAEPARHDHATIATQMPLAAGTLQVAWWDPDRGEPIATQALAHPGGVLVLHPPPFRHHIAFKLTRGPEQPGGAPTTPR